MPLLTTHIYWREKAEFQLESDTYAHWVLFAVEEGEFDYRIGGEKGRAGPGEIVACPPGEPFWRKTVTPLTFHFISFDPEPGEDWPAGKSSAGNRTRLFDNLMLLADRPVREYARHLVRDIGYLLRSANQESKPGASPADDPDMKQAAGLIREQALQGVRLKQLAASLGLSQVQFTRRFRAAFGMTPMDYVSSVRIRRACALLSGTSEKLDSIARQCGYENGFYFSRAFTRETGVNPSEYRRRYRV